LIANLLHLQGPSMSVQFGAFSSCCCWSNPKRGVLSWNRLTARTRKKLRTHW
jgi:hypothetical protein